MGKEACFHVNADVNILTSNILVANDFVNWIFDRLPETKTVCFKVVSCPFVFINY